MLELPTREETYFRIFEIKHECKMEEGGDSISEAEVTKQLFPLNPNFEDPVPENNWI